MIPSLSKRVLTSILSVLLLSSIFAMSQIADAGGLGVTPRTDEASNRLAGYWDLRERESFFQITNTSATPVTVHIQLFNAGDNCTEFDYYDDLTPRDTHIYNVASLDRNNGTPLAAPDLTGGHGIIAVSVSPQGKGDNVLTGNFRIIDNTGYEYRTNMAGEGLQGNQFQYALNFNDINGLTSADLVVITYDTDGDTVFPFLNVFQPTIYDEHENPISCPEVLLGCYSNIAELIYFEGLGFANNLLNVGINQSVTNSKGGPSLCLGTDTVGHLELQRDLSIGPPSPVLGLDTVIFIGLNNGSGTGSIDHATVGGNEITPG